MNKNLFTKGDSQSICWTLQPIKNELKVRKLSIKHKTCITFQTLCCYTKMFSIWKNHKWICMASLWNIISFHKKFYKNNNKRNIEHVIRYLLSSIITSTVSNSLSTMIISMIHILKQPFSIRVFRVV